MLAFQIGGSWYQCIARRSFSENLIPALSACILAWAARRYAKSAPVLALHLDSAGLLFFTAMIALTAAGNYFHFARLSWLGFLAATAGLIWVLAGRAYLKHWAPLFLFSLLLLPGAPIAAIDWTGAWLKMTSLRLTIALSSLFIPITAKGNVFFVKGDAFEITTACCGMSMWVGLTFLVLLWQIYHRLTVGRTVSLVFLATCLSLLMNGVRLCITAVVAYWTTQSFALSIHSNLEYLLYPIAAAVLWLCMRRISPNSSKRTAGYFPIPSLSPARKLLFFTLVSALLAIPVVVEQLVCVVEPKRQRAAMPTLVGDWHGTDVVISEAVRKNYTPLDVTLTWRMYTTAAQPPVYALVQQATNLENLHDGYACLVFAGAQPKRIGTVRIPGTLASSGSLFEYTLGNQRSYALFLYQSKAGTAIFPANGVWEQLNLAFLGRLPCRLIELNTAIAGSPEQSVKRLTQFASAFSRQPL
jgi:exosortase/archaeosortase family protein